MNIEIIKALCPEFEYIERTLNRQGPKCQDFYEGHIRDLKTHVLNLGKALAEARQALEWLDITDAPKDGTYILTFSPKAEDFEKRSIRINRWHNECWWNCNNTYWPPTHFRYIPTPPSVKEGA